jgi:hypothetical protein
MAELKTKLTQQKPTDFIKTVEPEQKRKDSQTLLKMFEKATGEKPAMWGTSIVGFGTYHYESERSAQKGDWLLVGFSPRKQNLTLYILNAVKGETALLKKLGKLKSSNLSDREVLPQYEENRQEVKNPDYLNKKKRVSDLPLSSDVHIWPQLNSYVLCTCFAFRNR